MNEINNVAMGNHGRYSSKNSKQISQITNDYSLYGIQNVVESFYQTTIHFVLIAVDNNIIDYFNQ